MRNDVDNWELANKGIQRTTRRCAIDGVRVAASLDGPNEAHVAGHVIVMCLMSLDEVGQIQDAVFRPCPVSDWCIHADAEMTFPEIWSVANAPVAASR